MPVYTKAQTDLLTDLINEANPGLNLHPVDMENTRLGIPYPKTPVPGEIADTSIEVFPRDGSKFIGRAVVHYRRITLERFFANMMPTFTRWRNGRVYMTDIIEWVNERYNLPLIIEDFGDTYWSSSTAIRRRAVKPQSLCFQGTLQFVWNEGKRELDQIFPTTDTQSRIWDVRHGGEEDERPLLTLAGYGNNYSGFLRNIDGIPNGHTVTANSGQLQTLVDRFNRIGDAELSIRTHHTEPGGLAGLQVAKYALPSDLVPEANAEGFTNVLTVTSKEDSWFGGRLLFHYDVIRITVLTPTVGFSAPLSVDINDNNATPGSTMYWSLVLVSGVTRSSEIVNQGTYQPDGRFANVVTSVPTSIREDSSIEVKMVIRQGNQGGQVIGESGPISVYYNMDVAVSKTEVLYEEEVIVLVTETGHEPGRVIYWELVATEGEFSQPITGTITPDFSAFELPVSLPKGSAVDIGLKWKIVFYENDEITEEIDDEGNIVTIGRRYCGESPTVSMDDVSGSRAYSATYSPYTWTVPDGVSRLIIDASAAGGGGGGGCDKNGWYGCIGGDGGAGQMGQTSLLVQSGDVVEIIVGEGGEGGRRDYQTKGTDGQDGGDTIIKINGQTRYTREGGGGGEGGWQTTTRSDAAGTGSSGSQSSPYGSLGGEGSTSGTASSGEDGYVNLSWRGW